MNDLTNHFSLSLNDPFKVIQQFGKSVEKGNKLTSIEEQTLAEIIGQVMKPLNYDDVFDRVVFGTSKLKSKLMSVEGMFCTTHLGNDYYICNCTKETLYFCADCHKQLKRHNAHKKRECMVGCFMSLWKGKLSLSQTQKLSKKEKCPEAVAVAISELLMVALDCLYKKHIAEAQRILQYLINIFRSPVIAHAAASFLFTIDVAESKMTQYNRFFQAKGSGQKLFSVLSDYVFDYYQTDPSLAVSLLMVLCQLDNESPIPKQHETIMISENTMTGVAAMQKGTRVINSVYSSAFISGLPTQISTEVVMKTNLALFGKKNPLTREQQAILILNAVNSTVYIKDQIIKSYKTKTPNELQKDYAGFVLCLDNIAYAVQYMFHVDKYQNLCDYILNSTTIWNDFVKMLGSYMPKLTIASITVTSLYDILQKKLYAIYHIYFTALTLNMNNIQKLDNIMPLLNELKSRIYVWIIHEESKKYITRSVRSEIGVSLHVRYALLLHRCYALFIRFWLTQEMNKLTSKSKNKMEIDFAGFFHKEVELLLPPSGPINKSLRYKLSVSLDKYNQALNNAKTLCYDYDILDFFIENNTKLITTSPQHKHHILNNYVTLFSFDPVFGRRLDYFMYQVIFTQYDFISEEASRKLTSKKQYPLDKLPKDFVVPLNEQVPHELEQNEFYFRRLLAILDEDNTEPLIFTTEHFVTCYFLMYIDYDCVKHMIKSPDEVSRLILINKDVAHYITIENDTVLFAEKGPVLNDNGIVPISGDNFRFLKLFNPYIPEFVVSKYQDHWIKTYVSLIRSGALTHIHFMSDSVNKYPQLYPHIVRMINVINITSFVPENTVQRALFLRYAWIRAWIYPHKNEDRKSYIERKKLDEIIVKTLNNIINTIQKDLENKLELTKQGKKEKQIDLKPKDTKRLSCQEFLDYHIYLSVHFLLKFYKKSGVLKFK
ncbi:UBR-type domain-containing protein [Entamoeba marina]